MEDPGRVASHTDRDAEHRQRELPAVADQAGVTLGNTNKKIAGLTISDAPTQAEVQALQKKAEELAGDVHEPTGAPRLPRPGVHRYDRVQG